MENNNEDVISSPNNDKVELSDDDNPDVLREKFAKLSEAHAKLSDTNRQLYARTKKAEGFEQDADGNWVKTIIKEPTKTKAEKAKQSDVIDYGKRAFLLASGLKMEEMSFFEEQMQTSGIQEPEKLLANPYFQSALKAHRDEIASRSAAPSGGRTATGENSSSKPEYWIAKGELPPNTPENQQLRQAVVAERYRLAKTPGRFTDNPVVIGK